MPEESKKGDKKKNDPKDQRRPRQRHQQTEKKVDKKAEEPKIAPKVTVPQKPVYESPPPEFFKNLKRETDEILKITEEENSKYKKKEIQSNWTKYEMPIETYDEIEEQENIGADYEKLIQAPLSIGGHFQFKHEKSWDVNTGPSLYDKYFDINMEDLNLALCTIPFYERNDIDQSIFTQTDILSMNNRTARFKQKYFNDKSYATPETEAQDKILSSLREKEKEDCSQEDIVVSNNDIEINTAKKDKTNETPKHISQEPDTKTEIDLDIVNNINISEEKIKITSDIENIYDSKEDTTSKVKLRPESPKIETKKIINEVIEKSKEPKVIEDVENDDIIFGNSKTPDVKHEISFPQVPDSKVIPVPKAAAPPKTKQPVIESPEDLEKWLDDFLDG